MQKIIETCIFLTIEVVVACPGERNVHCGHLPGAEPGSGLSLLAMGLCRDTGPCLGATSDCKHIFLIFFSIQ